MSARVLFVGLDAVDAGLVEEWSSAGRLPTLGRMARHGHYGRIATCVGHLPGAVWFELATGRSVGRTGCFFESHAIRTGEARMRRLTAEECGRDETFWRTASDEGNRVGVVDLPHAPFDPRINGIQIAEWGVHDRLDDVRVHPDALEREILSSHGCHPVHDCNLYADDDSGYRTLIADLKTGIEKKRKLILDVLCRETWDLFACAFAEGHCAGHHLWHLHELTGARDPSLPANDLARGLLEVYRSLDEALAEVVAAAGDECDVIVMASHGMSRSSGGPQLLPEILARLQLAGTRDGAPEQAIRRLQASLKYRVPRRYAAMARQVGRLPLIRQLQSNAGCALDPFENPRIKAASIPNNRVGAIRFNVRGREPSGSVERGSELDDMTDELRAALLALRDPTSTEPIIDDALTINEVVGADAHPDLPDLLVVFRSDLGPIESCVSERVGRVDAPINKPRNPRSGDHRPVSGVWLTAPSRRDKLNFEGGKSVDLAPTILTLMGLEPPAWIDGKSWVA
ncbi:MAG: hypothetical protein GY791_05835 [Alphaproteobacteria bacterium]|nr:hypothetical protein [Alphaproteobacteria bacterium]